MSRWVGVRATWRVALAAVLSAGVVMAVAPSAVAAPASAAGDEDGGASSCPQPVILVHDMARSAGEWDAMRHALSQSGRCAYTFTYGAAALPGGGRADTVSGSLGEAAGRGTIAESAGELGAFVGQVRRAQGARRVSIVAHGAGGLVAQQYIATHNGNGVAKLVTIGPMWRGTRIAGLAGMERLSRRLGTYETILQLEKPVIDPICAGCRALIAGSDFLTHLHRLGTVTDGVRYVNIVSLADGLVVPPLSARQDGMRTVVLQDEYPADRTGHFALPDDPAVQGLVIRALAR